MFVVRDLISKPLFVRPLEEQVRIVSEGCPPCAINDLWEDVDDEKGLIRATEVVYGRGEWLTSCPVTQRLFCWTCVLFSEADSEWARHGCSDFGTLAEKVHGHETSVEHIQSQLDMKTFCGKHVKAKESDNASRIRDLQLGQKDGLKLLTDAIVTSLGVHPSPSYRSYDYDGTLDPGELATFLEALRAFSPLNPHLSWASRFLEATPSALPHLVDAACRVVRSAVRAELAPAPHVSVVLSEHSRTPRCSLVSTVLSFPASDGSTTERFVGFASMPRPRTGRDVVGHVTRVLDEFGARDRLLAYSLDGAAVPAGQLGEFTSAMLAAHPGAFFVPWHGHCLEDCLMQSLLDDVPEVSEFWRGLVGMRKFFARRVAEDRRPSFLRGHIVWASHEFRQALVKYLATIVNAPLAWAPDDVSCALGCLQWMQRFRNLFLLHLFARLFACLKPLSGLPQPEQVFDADLAEGVRRKLHQVGAEGFERMLAAATLEAALLPTVTPSSAELESGRYRIMFEKVVPHLLGHLPYRLADLRRLQFASVVLRSRGDQDGRFFWSVAQCHKGIAVDRLRTELEVLRSNMQLLLDEWNDMSLDSLAGVHQFLLRTGAGRALPNLMRLAEMIHALPVYKPADEAVSKYQTIEDWGEYKDSLVRPGDKAVLVVEVDLLRELARRDSFYDDVFEEFTSRCDLKPLWASGKR